jgi:CRP/FNR family cyclic AMP-dependent transcriptional regulator
MSEAQKVRFLRRVPLFRPLERHILTKVARQIRCTRVRRGEKVPVAQGEFTRMVMAVDGKFLCVIQTRLGRLVLGILAPGQTCGEEVVLHRKVLRLTAIGREDGLLCWLDSRRFLNLLRSVPGLAALVSKILAERAVNLQQRLVRLARDPVGGRLAHALLDLFDMHGVTCPHGHEAEVLIARQDLADLVGASRQTVSGVLRQLAQDGILALPGRRICLRDAARLRERAA